ncbi:hypothetical protein NDU88_001069 [Pleurodeles waltl]|uniref:Uncharacterized protein n=1 Tax=Pleurodeles waltl TaxID=8319 RepID=A0AAV7KPE7_PLEWA|nr:hypothetical protein NDU88_001069 [Pleurodeles waltl]
MSIMPFTSAGRRKGDPKFAPPHTRGNRTGPRSPCPFYQLSTFCPVVSAHMPPGVSPLHLRSALFMSQGRSNTSTFSDAPNSSTGRPRHLLDSVPVLSFSPVPAPPHSVFGTFGPKMAVATSKVRFIDPLRRPSVSVSSALSNGVPRLEPPPAARLREPTSQAARGRSSFTAPARSPGQPDNAGTFRAPASPPL